MKLYTYTGLNKASNTSSHGLISFLKSNYIDFTSCGYKVKKYGNTVEVLTSVDISLSETVQTEDNLLTLSNIEEKTLKNVVNGDKVVLMGTVNYARRIHDEGKIHQERKGEEFIRFFGEKKLGISVSNYIVNKNKEHWENDRVWIKNSFSFVVEGVVINSDIIVDIQKNNVGAKKSYGFGWVDMNIVK